VCCGFFLLDILLLFRIFNTFQSQFLSFYCEKSLVKLPAHRAGLPGKVISFYIVPLDPAYLLTGRQGGAWGARSGQEIKKER
jgi:hypothetical protein